jgi:ABC-type iron transport system FetAB ATPase subunit
MKINSVLVENFRALTSITLPNLSDGVVLAGPNGCGKSRVLDSLRLLKSAYGSYQQNESDQWFSEFQIDLRSGRSHLLPLFQDKSKPIRISASFSLRKEEQIFLKENGESLLTRYIWSQSQGQANVMMPPRDFDTSPTYRTNREFARREASSQLSAFISCVEKNEIIGTVVINPKGYIESQKNLLLELVFSVYDPQHLGVIDYHGPNRNYGRERINNVNLTIDASEDRQRQSALYNYNNKYNNLKTELASEYVRHLLERERNPSAARDDSLTQTLKELFAAFFPGKQFQGPQPTADGRLLFPVRLANGSEHDIDDLSSGEKEVLYGYLRLHNSAPRNSIIMIDEPELHLNPRLLRGLASFYYRHLSQRLNNQIWLITHSDALIREAVNQSEYTVFHIHPTSNSQKDQATPVKGTEEIEKLVIELVGDLAAYRPGSKIVIFESTEDAAFDAYMTCALFPEFEQRTNSISAGNKQRVGELYEILEKAKKAGTLPAEFFSITDMDDGIHEAGPTRRFTWDMYHIENYLLNADFLLKVMNEIAAEDHQFADSHAVKAALRDCAKDTIPSLISHKLRVYANSIIVPCVNLSFNPMRSDIAVALGEAVERTKGHVVGKIEQELSAAKLGALEKNLSEEYTKAVSNDDWMRAFRGRDILKLFVGKFGKGVAYDVFRNLLIARMRDVNFKPPGMMAVVTSILNA